MNLAADTRSFPATQALVRRVMTIGELSEIERFAEMEKPLPPIICDAVIDPETGRVTGTDNTAALQAHIDAGLAVFLGGPCLFRGNLSGPIYWLGARHDCRLIYDPSPAESPGDATVADPPVEVKLPRGGYF